MPQKCTFLIQTISVGYLHSNQFSLSVRILWILAERFKFLWSFDRTQEEMHLSSDLKNEERFDGRFIPGSEFWRKLYVCIFVWKLNLSDLCNICRSCHRQPYMRCPFCCPSVDDLNLTEIMREFESVSSAHIRFVLIFLRCFLGWIILTKKAS